MRWLLDQGLPRGAAACLNSAGHDAIHVGDIGMAAAADAAILAYAVRESRTVVTLDADFHALMALSGTALPSVIRIREEGLRSRELAELLLRVFGQFKIQLGHGCLLSVRAGHARFRALPLV